MPAVAWRRRARQQAVGPAAGRRGGAAVDKAKLRGAGWKHWELVTSSVGLDGAVTLQPVPAAPDRAAVLHCSYDEAVRAAAAYNVGKTRGSRAQLRKARPPDSSPNTT
eukprot:SAG11_NODE_2231_length_3658_cov_2.124754_2_plen_108_part_00